MMPRSAKAFVNESRSLVTYRIRRGVVASSSVSFFFEDQYNKGELCWLQLLAQHPIVFQ
eukprot:m.289652 g.289652  ORF g.289652 m.289652 type:complete len:59 (+) comp16376_c3_seq3:444-620(+)